MIDQTFELRVASGPQRGATLTLQAGIPVSLGSAMGADVLLRDRTIPARALRITPDTLEWKVELLDQDAQAEIEGQRLAAGQTTHVPAGAELRVGGTTLLVGKRGPGVPNEMADTAGNRTSNGISPLLGSAASPRSTRRRLVYWLTAALLVLAAAGGAGWYGTTQAAAEAERAARPGVAALLSGVTGLEHVRAEESDAGATVRGFVATRADRIHLDTLLKRAERDDVRRDIVVGEQLVAAVEDVYRLHGVDARVEALGAHAVRIETSLGDADRLAALELAVRADVPRLTTIDVVDTPPDVPTPASESDQELDPGKRVEMVVSGVMAHVLTEDGSRYFIGAVLPNGQRIQAISEGKVTLARGDDEIEMTF